MICEVAGKTGSKAIICSHWSDGSQGAEALAEWVVETANTPAAFSLLYDDSIPLFDKINMIAKKFTVPNTQLLRQAFTPSSRVGKPQVLEICRSVLQKHNIASRPILPYWARRLVISLLCAKLDYLQVPALL